MPLASPEARREYQRAWVARRRADWFRKNGPCARCGSTLDLELDHVDPGHKISHRIWSWSWQRIDAEVAKCQVLCHECHAEKTSAEKSRPIAHGTEAGYHRCHCDRCRAAHAEYNATWRAGQGPPAEDERWEREMALLRARVASYLPRASTQT